MIMMYVAGKKIQIQMGPAGSGTVIGLLPRCKKREKAAWWNVGNPRVRCRWVLVGCGSRFCIRKKTLPCSIGCTTVHEDMETQDINL